MRPFSVGTRFALVGLACAAAHNVIVLVADRWHIHYALSCVMSYVVVVVLGFMLHVHFTFQQAPTMASFWRYCISMAANYPITLALLFLMCDIAGWPVAVAAPTATVLLVAWNFLASRWAIIRKPAATSLTSPSRQP
jgi:putative flippase GtrA